MPKDIDEELDAIFTRHNARVSQARTEAASKTAATEKFSEAASLCLDSVVTPALQQMAQALNARGVAARVAAEGNAVRLDVPVSRHVRLGHGVGGYPYLRVRPDGQSQRLHFERNTSGGRGGSPVADYTIPEVNAELVKTLVMDLVRALYGPT